MRRLSASILSISLLVVSPLAVAAVDAEGIPIDGAVAKSGSVSFRFRDGFPAAIAAECPGAGRAVVPPGANRKAGTALLSAYISGKTVRARFDGCYGGAIRVTAVDLKR
jgi:hypothetical protein